jgi:hypothetical protein
MADRAAEEFSSARVTAALAALDDLRHDLEAASRSEVTLADLAESVRDFWRDQEPLVNQVAATVLEMLRLQALEQAYRWRDQLQVSDQPARPQPRDALS